MTKAQKAQMARELCGAQSFGGWYQITFKELLFSLAWHWLFCMCVHTQHCLDTQMLQYG